MRISKRLMGPAYLTTSAVTIYTCPSGRRGRILFMQAQCNSGLSATFKLSIGAQDASTNLWDSFSVSVTDPLREFVLYVVEAGEIVQASASANTSLVLMLSGDEEVLT